MKKKGLLLWSLLIIGLFFSAPIVKAEEEAEMENFCRYQVSMKKGLGKDDLKEGKYKYTFFDVVDRSGTIKFQLTESSKLFVDPAEFKTSQLSNSAFYSGGKFACPGELYANVKKRSDGMLEIELTPTGSGKYYVFEKSQEGTRPVSSDDLEISEGTCEGILGSFKKDLEGALKIMRFLGPIFVIVLGTYDYCAGIFSKDADLLKKANSRLMKRLILIAVLFFLPILLNIILGIIDQSYTSCIN